MNGIPESQMLEFAPDVIALIGTGAAKVIPLTQGKVTIVDAEDYERLSKYKWYASKHRKNYYAVHDTWFKGKRGKSLRMHREVLQMSQEDSKLSDHKNRNTLDNRRSNLRIATYSLNNYNTERIHRNNLSGYRGVCWTERDHAWRAYVRIDGKQKGCGYYDNPISAAIAHDEAVLKYRGQDAILNFPKGVLV